MKATEVKPARKGKIEITEAMLRAGRSELLGFSPDYESYATRVNFIPKAALEAEDWKVKEASNELLSRLVVP